jgi:hypothetical protein
MEAMSPTTLLGVLATRSWMVTMNASAGLERTLEAIAIALLVISPSKELSESLRRLFKTPSLNCEGG